MNTLLIETVLVPIDFSAISRNALDTAIAVCKRQLAKLTLLHVVESNYALLTPGTGVVNGSLMPEMVKKANESMNDLARGVRVDHDLVVDCVVQSGNPSDEICLWAEKINASLIIMGTHGASGLRELLLGTNAYSVVKNAQCAVMTIPGTNQWLDFKKVLFPVRAVPNARDKYLAVRPIIKKNASSLLIAGIVKKNDLKGWRDVQVLVEAIKTDITQDEVTCGSQIHPCENVAKQVLAIANLERPDLIVITATLDSTLRNFFIGPYTQEIVNHARFPVLSIKPPSTRMRGGKNNDLDTA